MTVGEKIRFLRTQKGLTQKELANTARYKYRREPPIQQHSEKDR